MPTPEWTYKCDDNSLGALNCSETVQAALNKMRVFNDAGVERSQQHLDHHLLLLSILQLVPSLHSQIF